jgi:diacylglycerol kinase (ATP)
MKLLLVYNPHAANRRAARLLPAVKKHFAQHNVSVDLRLTASPGHAVAIVAEADFENYQGVIAAGGDGTLFEAVNGYYRNRSGRRIPLGVLPIGTGNAFARDLNLDSGRLEEAVAIIAGGRTRRVDVGRFSCGKERSYFLNILGLGFVADVTATAARLKAFGNIAYTFGVLARTLRLKAYPLTIETDGRRLERENIFAEISNTRYTSNFLMAPAAEIDDGLLDITLLGKISRRGLISSFPKIFTGEHVQLEEVETFQAKRLRLITQRPRVLTPDGELVGTTPVEVECLRRDIEVFWK